MLHRIRLLMVSATVVLALAGCSQPAAFPELQPLRGEVKRDGERLTEGGLIFIPESGDGGGLTFNAAVAKDGTFTAQSSRIGAKNTTEARPGVPAGRYKVVYHPPSDGSRTGLEIEAEGMLTVAPGDNKVEVKLPAKVQEPPPEKGE